MAKSKEQKRKEALTRIQNKVEFLLILQPKFRPNNYASEVAHLDSQMKAIKDKMVTVLLNRK